MRLLVPVLAIVLATACRASLPATVPETGSYGGGISELIDISGSLSKLKDLLKHGDEKLGIPVLDPFFQQHMDLDLNEQGLLSINGTLDNVREAGLSDYTVTRGEVNVIGLLANVGLLFKEIDIMTKYNVQGSLADNIQLFGAGNISLVVRGLSVTLDLKLHVKDGKLSASNVVLHAHLKQFIFRITGLYNDDEMSAIMSKSITNMMPKLIDDYQDQLSEKVSPIVEKLLNNVLKNINISDVISG